MNGEEILEKWIIRDIKHKDIIRRSIISIDKVDDKIVVHEKTGDKKVILKPTLEGFDSEIDNGKTVVVTFNSVENLKYLVKAWDSIKDNAGLCIVFINPASQTETKWMIFPRAHAMIADEDTLAQGLRSMYETVEPVTSDTLKRLR